MFDIAELTFGLPELGDRPFIVLYLHVMVDPIHWGVYLRQATLLLSLYITELFLRAMRGRSLTTERDLVVNLYTRRKDRLNMFSCVWHLVCVFIRTLHLIPN